MLPVACRFNLVKSAFTRLMGGLVCYIRGSFPECGIPHWDCHMEAIVKSQPRRPLTNPRSLAWQLALYTSLLLLATGLLIGFVGHRYSRGLVEDGIHRLLESVAANRKAMVLAYVDRQQARVSMVASRTRLRNLVQSYLLEDIDRAEMQSGTREILRDAMIGADDLKAISIIGLDGQLLTSSEENPADRNWTELPGFSRCRETPERGFGHLSEPFFAEEGNVLARLSAPVLSRDDECLGVMVVRMDAGELVSILGGINSGDRRYLTGELLIGRADGDEIHYLLPSRREAIPKADAASVPKMVEAIEGRSGIGSANYDGVPVLLRYEPIDLQPGHQNWGLVAKVDQEEAYRPLAYLNRAFLAVPTGLLGLGLLGAVVMARRLSRPIRELKDAANSLVEGDFNRRVNVDRHDELGELADTFNYMAARLHTLHTHLEKQVEQRTSELADARDTAEAANKAKSEFLARMSHEIRTPLNAVIGLTEIVMNTDLNETQKEYLGTVVDSAESLLGIINDILDFSKIEAGKFDLENVPFNVADTVGDTMKSLALRARHKGIELACFVDPAVPTNLVGDPARLRQILTNLVANAIKFTHRGEVVTRVEPSSESVSDGRQQLTFTVTDTGIGIHPEQLDRLFGGSGRGPRSRFAWR